MDNLEKEFFEALNKKAPDFDKAKRLIAQGFDINATDRFNESVLDNCLLNFSSFPSECDYCESESCKTCEQRINTQLILIIEFFIENGWDSVTHGLNCIASLVHTTHDAQMFYAAKRILECPLSENEEDYENALEAIGTEESFQRCCGECHDQENLYYAMYEIVDAKMKGKPFDGIFPYYSGLGKKIDKIIYFADRNDFVETSRGTEFEGDFGFVCGNNVIVVQSSINILLMNDRISEIPQIDRSNIFGEGVIGATIVDISFKHQSKNRANECYGQPTIIIKLDNGKEISFTHNFGELPDGKAQARFITDQTNNTILDRISHLFALCANTEINIDKIDAYIVGANMSPEDVTRTAIRLAEKFMFEVDSFKSDHGRCPNENELVSSNWLSLFDLFLKHGLDPNFVYCDDGVNHYNLLDSLKNLDNRAIIYKLFRLLFQKGADPNVVIDDESLFEKIDCNVVTFATLLEIEDEDRIPYEKDFRLWLLMLAYGGHLKHTKNILKVKDGFDIDMFDNCESFSYRKEVTADDWFLHIYVTKTGEEVAIL